jgi:hypothetical protein
MHEVSEEEGLRRSKRDSRRLRWEAGRRWVVNIIVQSRQIKLERLGR